MSRFFDWDMEEGPPPALWQQACANALAGRRGQAVLRELKAALLALPAPRLIEGSLVWKGEVCALGALAGACFERGQRTIWNGEPITTLAQLEECIGDDHVDEFMIVDFGEAMGLRKALAWSIAYENDEGWLAVNETPEQRWARVMRWTERNLST